MRKVDSAMILAAGLGTRLKPFTLHHPKALAVVNGKTVLQRNIEYLQLHGIYKVVVNVHHFADQVVEHIDAHKGFGSTVAISNETDGLLETGGGLQKAIPLFGNATDIVILNADILTDLNLADMMTKHLAAAHDATLAVSNRKSSRVFLFDENERLGGWRNTATGEEKLTSHPNNLHPMAFSGLHIVNEGIFNHMPFTGKFSMVDVYLAMANDKRIMAYAADEARFMDIGTMEKLALAATIFA